MINIEVINKVYKNIINGNPYIINTGFYELDEILSNVDYGSLITISARPAMGKTALLLCILNNLLLKNKKCLFFSSELSTESIVKRLIAVTSQTPLLNLHKQIDKIDSAIERIASFNVDILEDVFDIEEIELETKKQKPEYIFIDSAHLLDNFDDILPKLKSIAKANDCVVFITCKLTNKIEKRRDKHPRLSDLRETGRADIISDVVLYIYRACYYNIQKERHKAEIIIAKNRNGATGTITLLFKANIPLFYNYNLQLLKEW